MSFNGSGQFQLNSGGLPFVTGTTISSTHANNLNTDLASGLSNVICKDGQTTVTANLPMSTFRHTNVGVASARTDYARASQVQDSTLIAIGTIAGTNTITGSLAPAITAYAAGQFYTFIPANTNTGATTISINSVGARNIFWNGAACVGGEITQNIPCVIYDDGTRFHIVGNGFNAPFLDTHAIVEGSSDSTKKVRIEADGLTTATTRVLTPMDADYTIGDRIGLTTSASTSGTSVNSPAIAAGTRRITVTFSGVSTNGTDPIVIRLGDAGGVETSGYSGAESQYGTATPANIAASGFSITHGSAATVLHGQCILTLIDAATFTWSASWSFGLSNTTTGFYGAGSKALTAELTSVSVTTTGGTNTFDAGLIGFSYER